MLLGPREGILKGLRPYSLHGEVYYELQYLLADEPEGPVHAARLPHDAMYPNAQAGDRVHLHFVMSLLVKVEPAGTRSGAARPGV